MPYNDSKPKAEVTDSRKVVMFKKLLVAVSILLFGVSAFAGSAGPYDVVSDTTRRVTEVIESSREYVEEDPDRFYAQVQTIMDEVVDFDSFARGVMGKYGSRKYYSTLDDEGKERFREQVTRFTETFKSRLIKTYAKGLLAFDGNRIEVLPLPEGVDMTGSVNIEQHIYGNAPQPYVVFYKLRKDREGEWKLRNVSIEGINLGRTYQSQFAQAVQRYNGDLDQVIDNWSVAPQEVAEKAAE